MAEFKTLERAVHARKQAEMAGDTPEYNRIDRIVKAMEVLSGPKAPTPSLDPVTTKTFGETGSAKQASGSQPEQEDGGEASDSGSTGPLVLSPETSSTDGGDETPQGDGDCAVCPTEAGHECPDGFSMLSADPVAGVFLVSDKEGAPDGTVLDSATLAHTLQAETDADSDEAEGPDAETKEPGVLDSILGVKVQTIDGLTPNTKDNDDR